MTPQATLARFREYMVGPTRFMNLLSCFELGIVDALRDKGVMTAAEIGAAVGVKPDAVEQLMLLPVKDGFVAYEEGSGTYRLDALAGVDQADLTRVVAFMDMIKVVMLRQMFYLTESVRDGTVVGLNRLYGFDGNMFGAVAQLADLRESWVRLAEIETAGVYPWFFRSIDIPSGARVLDVLGGTGFGAVMAHQTKASPGLHVTTFDRPENEAECLRVYREHGIAENSSFIGGNVLEGLPTGYDVVLIKHFIDIFDKSEALKILENANKSLDAGGTIIILAPVYPEDVRQADDYQVDFFPTFILGCAIGAGGLQKVSTYSSWLEECGFEVTKVIAKDPAEIPADAILNRVILCATKKA